MYMAQFPWLFASPCYFPFVSPLCPLLLTWHPPSCDRNRPPRSQVACKLTPFAPPFTQPTPSLQLPRTPTAPRPTTTTSGIFRLLLSGTETTETNKRPTKTAANLVKYQRFNSPYHKFCLFRLFWYRSEISKQTENFFWVSRKSKPKNNRNRLNFGLFRFELRKNGFEDPLIENVFFLEMFSVCFGLLRENSVCFGCFDFGPKQWNKLKKMFFGFAKQTKTDCVSVCFGSNRKKNLIVSRTP